MMPVAQQQHATVKASRALQLEGIPEDSGGWQQRPSIRADSAAQNMAVQAKVIKMPDFLKQHVKMKKAGNEGGKVEGSNGGDAIPFSDNPFADNPFAETSYTPAAPKASMGRPIRRSDGGSATQHEEKVVTAGRVAAAPSRRISSGELAACASVGAKAMAQCETRVQQPDRSASCAQVAAAADVASLSPSSIRLREVSGSSEKGTSPPRAPAVAAVALLASPGFPASICYVDPPADAVGGLPLQSTAIVDGRGQEEEEEVFLYRPRRTPSSLSSTSLFRGASASSLAAAEATATASTKPLSSAATSMEAEVERQAVLGPASLHPTSSGEGSMAHCDGSCAEAPQAHLLPEASSVVSSLEKAAAAADHSVADEHPAAGDRFSIGGVPNPMQHVSQSRSISLPGGASNDASVPSSMLPAVRAGPQPRGNASTQQPGRLGSASRAGHLGDKQSTCHVGGCGSHPDVVRSKCGPALAAVPISSRAAAAGGYNPFAESFERPSKASPDAEDNPFAPGVYAAIVQELRTPPSARQ